MLWWKMRCRISDSNWSLDRTMGGGVKDMPDFWVRGCVGEFEDRGLGFDGAVTRGFDTGELGAACCEIDHWYYMYLRGFVSQGRIDE